MQDVFRAGEDDFLSQFGSSTSKEQHRVLRAVRDCRTAALGGHVSECDACGNAALLTIHVVIDIVLDARRLKRAEWTEARESELLPVPYMHVVFTLPQELSPLALQNQRTVYKTLFQGGRPDVEANRI